MMALWVMVEDMEFCRNSNFDNKEHEMMVLGSKQQEMLPGQQRIFACWLDNNNK